MYKNTLEEISSQFLCLAVFCFKAHRLNKGPGRTALARLHDSLMHCHIQLPWPVQTRRGTQVIAAYFCACLYK